MSKSLTELRAERPQARAERSHTICLRPDLYAQMQALSEERDVLAAEQRAKESGDTPKKMAEGVDPTAHGVG